MIGSELKVHNMDHGLERLKASYITLERRVREESSSLSIGENELMNVFVQYISNLITNLW